MDAVTTPSESTEKATRREWIGLAVLALAALMYVMDLTVLHLAVPAMSADLQPTSSQLLWIIDIYGFFVAGTLITMGTLGDRVGRRKLLLIGAAGFGITSVMAAYSWSAEMLILSRALLGLSGATLAPATLSLIFAMFADPRERSIAVGVWIGAFSAGSAIGPILGGLMLEFFWWGSVFLLALPVMAALLILGPRILPEYKDPTAGRLDVPSAAMAITAILALIYGLKEIAAYGLSSVALASVVLGLVVGALWVARQRRLEDPMIDIGLFRDRVFDTALGINFLAVFVAVGYFLFVAQYLQLVAGLSPLQAGLWSLPSALAFVIGSQAGPRIAQRVRPSTIVGAGLAVAGAGLVMLAFVDGAGQLVLLVAASVVISLGLAPVFGLTTEMIVGSAPEEKAGAASGISETGAELGGALGIAILGSIGVVIYRSTLARELPAELPADVVEAASDTLGAATTVAAEIPSEMGATVLGIAQSAFVDGMQISAAIAAVVAFGLAFAAAVLLRTAGGPDAPPSAETEVGERPAVELEPMAECG
jgi:DHA2 family multidrug resistance protein-like MFS transporter